jgi:uncharacterized protein
MKSTLVIGASENPERYSFIAVNRLLKHGHIVKALGAKAGKIENVIIETGFPDFKDIHTVTLYVNPARQKEYYEYIIGLQPKRVIFNPGTENAEFEKLLNEKNIETIEACTLVLLSIGEYDNSKG